MSWKLFIAKRIYSSGGKDTGVSGPAVRIAMAGIAVGLAVMTVSVAVVLGFKHQVRDRVAGLSSELLITPMDAAQSYQTMPVEATDSLLRELRTTSGVKRVQRYSTKPGMIMTDSAFIGMVLKGVAQDYDLQFMTNLVEEGEMPVFTDTVSSNSVLVSRDIADKLGLKVGDKLYTYYLDEDIRARRLTVSGIYRTNFTAFDEITLLTDLHTVTRLNSWKPEQVSGIEIKVDDYDRLEETYDKVREMFRDREDSAGNEYYVRTVEQVYQHIFAWLELLDLNVWVILILMTGVAGFTMISGLLIIILERAPMIGVLKALGTTDNALRKVFLTFAVFLIGRGMIWGNVVGLAICLLQGWLKLVKLDPDIYYVDAVPIELNLWLWLALNLATMLVSVLMLIGPSYLVSKISPVKSMRFE